MNGQSGHHGQDGPSAQVIAAESWFQLPGGQVREYQGACGISAPVAGQEVRCPHDPAVLLTLSCARRHVVRDVGVCAAHRPIVYQDIEAGRLRCIPCRDQGDERAAYIYAERPPGPRAAPESPGENA
jgi:hypothetical protein